MLNIRKQNSVGNEKKKVSGAGYCRVPAVVFSAVIALSPLSAQAVMPSGLPYSLQAAEADAGAGSTQSDRDAEASAAAEASAGQASTAAAAAASSEQAKPVPADDSALQGGREIRVHLAGLPEDPVPSRVMETDTASLLKMVSEGLVILDENNKPVPGCAKSWDVSKDGLQWTFHLREDLKWSDGSDMSAEDFVTLFQKTADPLSEALYGPDLAQNIAGYEDVLQGDPSALKVSAKDKHTLVVELTTPDPDFDRACASWALLPVREQIRDSSKKDSSKKGASGDWNFATGNGPYYIDSVAAGKEFVLKKNPWYRQDGSAPGKAFDTVHWIVSGDINQEYSDFLNGDIDAISAIPEEEEEILKSENLLQRRNFSDTIGICFNCRHEVLADAKVRRALSLAADRSFIASTILQDIYQPESGDGQNGKGDLVDNIPEAKKLLKEAGYKDGKGFPTLTCIADESGGAVLIADYLASAWKDLGIKVRVEEVDAKDLAQEKTAGTFDIFCGSIYLSSALPAAELANYTTENENNISGFSSEEFDRLIAEASQTKDEEKYRDSLEKAGKILLEEVPAAPLVTRCVSWLRSDAYPGITCDSAGCWQLWDTGAADASAENQTVTEIAEAVEAAAENADAEEDAGGTGEQPVSVKACIPEAGSSVEKENVSKALPSINSLQLADAGKKQEYSGALEYLRNSDTYFERVDQDACLIRQAWVYDGVSENSARLFSVPKYSEIHLTGIGNRRFVRIVHDRKFCYLDSNKVTTSQETVDSVRAKEKAGLAQKELLTASIHSAKESELKDRASDVRARTDEILEKIARREMLRTQTRNPNWSGPVLSRGRGSVMGPSGKETYYNLNMNGVVSIMRRMGNTDEYWVRDDGCKMLGDYIMCAANLRVHPRGSLVESSLGTCIVCDTGGFASRNSNQLDIAVTW